jgi:hypothetical protein
LGALELNLRNRLTGIDTNLDDLQAGVDASWREAGHLGKAAVSIDRLHLRAVDFNVLASAIVRHAKELESCVRDQRAAIQELRKAVTRLRDELTRSRMAVRPPPATAADRQRR